MRSSRVFLFPSYASTATTRRYSPFHHGEAETGFDDRIIGSSIGCPRLIRVVTYTKLELAHQAQKQPQYHKGMTLICSVARLDVSSSVIT